MASTDTYRTLEHLFGLLAWSAFGLGAAAILGLSALALLVEPAPSPEQFLTRLGLILAASLVPTAVFRGLAAYCRRRRQKLRPGAPSLIGSLSLFDDTTIQ